MYDNTRTSLMIAVAATVEENLVLPVLLRVQNVVAKRKKNHIFIYTQIERIANECE